MTVYRVGNDTPFARSLIRAAEAGKQVACVIELKARFDEERNLHWAAELERAGAHVTVGTVTLKTHAKVALVVRREASGLRSYAHIGTGNYHVRTARLYTDVGLLTGDPAITADVVKLFQHLTGRSETPVFDRLLVAPAAMRERFMALISREIEHRRAPAVPPASSSRICRYGTSGRRGRWTTAAVTCNRGRRKAPTG
jgi:polyphosphate kinase